MSRADPFQLPEWQALSRECKLIRQLIGSGVTALGNANYADKKGEYYVAFFGLSIGIERLAKLILIVDFAIKNSGKLPAPKVVSGFGHDLSKLIDEVEKISSSYGIGNGYSQPKGKIEAAILKCLDSFADARRGRYANFQTIGDPNLGSEFEPIRQWWETVAEAILESHFYGKRAERDVRMRAQMAEMLMGPFSMVRHVAEDGSLLTEVETASFQTGATAYVQKYGRYYALLVVRWLASIFNELSNYGCYKKNIEVLFGHYEHFLTYTVDDEFLKTRKRWPL